MTFQQRRFIFSGSQAGTLYGTPPLDSRASVLWFGSKSEGRNAGSCLIWGAHALPQIGFTGQLEEGDCSSWWNCILWIIITMTYEYIVRSRKHKPALLTSSPSHFFTSNVMQCYGWYPVMQWEIESMAKYSLHSVIIVDNQKKSVFYNLKIQIHLC